MIDPALLSQWTLKGSLLAFLWTGIAYCWRKRFPRTFVFSIGFAATCVSLWLLATTYEFSLSDRAHCLSRKLCTFSRSENPADYAYSVRFHTILGGGLLLFGIYAMVSAFVKKHIQFNGQSEHERQLSTVSAKGILQLLGLSVVVLVVVILWKSR
jgi:hypothetical protein